MGGRQKAVGKAGTPAGLLSREAALVGPPPVPPDARQKLQFERVTFEPGLIRVAVRNGGPAEVTVAQVLVDEALWQFAAHPGPTIPRLSRATLTIPYHWNEGDPVEVKVITSVGLVFNASVPIATTTPVSLGLLWLPCLRPPARLVPA